MTNIWLKLGRTGSCLTRLHLGRQLAPREQVLLKRLFSATSTSGEKKSDGALDKRTSNAGTSIVEQIFAEDERRPTTFVGKVKETSKDVTYFGLIAAGVALTAALVYALVREIWSSKSPGGVYNSAYKLIRTHPEVIDALGSPIKAHGQTSGRGRRRHAAHLEFEQDGVKCMRMKFYLEGSLRKATVQLEVRENPDNKAYDYRYILVQLDEYPPKSIVVIDNR